MDVLYQYKLFVDAFRFDLTELKLSEAEYPRIQLTVILEL